MKMTRFFSPFLLLIIAVFFCFSSMVAVFGDDADGSTLVDIHNALLQAAGYQSDTPPTVDQQTKLLHKALGMLHDIPHVYRGQLKRATADINSALDELAKGDTAHKARELIFDADDEIKAVM